MLCIAIALLPINTLSQTTNLIISEYAEGSSRNKYLEIYNGTGADIDLTGVDIRFAFNENSWSTTIPLTGTILNGDVFILARSTASSIITSQADQVSSTSFFNGNDAVGLFRSGLLIDIIGIPEENPTEGWDVAGTTKATANHTLVRKSIVCSPNTDWTTSAGTSSADSEWIVQQEDDWSNLGSHFSICGGVPVPLSSFFIILLFAGSLFLFRRHIR